jgi:hypothetical protein
LLPTLEGGVLCGDKAYCDGPLKEQLAEDQDLDLLTPIKKTKGQKTLSAADSLYSAAVSRMRQPIESLFNWINEKTGIQQASKVRSYQGASRSRFRSARRCDAPSRFQPLIRMRSTYRLVS